MKEIVIESNDAHQRLDKFILKRFKSMPKSLMYKYIRKKYIKLNGKKCDISTILNVGDVLSLYISHEFLDTPAVKNYDFLKAPSSFDIIYEDENIILIDKKQGLIVHPDKNYDCDTLVYRLKHYLYLKGEYNPDNENGFAPALVNRLDRNTGGIVIGAKNFNSLQILNAKMKNREIKKLYLCLVHGKMPKKEDLLIGYCTKNESTNKMSIHNKFKENSKEIKTKYKVLEVFNGNSLLEIELLTGRTHQIRAHLASIGNPILGDVKYGKNINKNSLYKFQALYSYKLVFNFTSQSTNLDYLNNKEFTTENVKFIKK